MAGLWLRLYTEIRNDRKLRRLSPAQRWLWVVILTIAKESPEPGSLLLSEGVPVTVEDLADDAAIPVDEVQQGIEAFITQKMLEQVDGVWRVIRWGEDLDRPPAHVWKALRKAVFERDNYTCAYCGARGTKLECDHIVPVAKGGTHTMDNLITACFNCNRSKKDKVLEEWL